MSKQEHPYAQVLRWIADAEEYQVRKDRGWGTVIEPLATLGAISSGYAPDPTDFRLKPRTITINGHEVPEPMRTEPKAGADYWFPLLLAPHGRDAGWCAWGRREDDLKRLERGMCHASKEAAEAHARALLSFTTTEAA